MLKLYLLKYCGKEYQKLLEIFGRKELELVGRQLKIYNKKKFQKRWLDLITNVF